MVRLKIACAVMHIPWDSQRVAWLAEILSVFPEAVVVADNNRDGLWPTAKRAWEAASSVEGATHCLVLQDDMIPVEGGRQRLEQAVTALPWTAISGFQPASWFASERYHAATSELVPSQGNVWGGTVILPIDLARIWTLWADQNTVARSLRLDDAKLTAYLMEHRIGTYHVHPPCFDHRGWDQSSIGSSANPWRRGLGAPRAILPF